MIKKLEEILKKMDSLPTREYLDRQMQRMKQEIRNENKQIIEKLEGKMFDLEAKNTEFRQAVGNLEYRIEELLDPLKNADVRLNDLEQYGRRNSIRISGLADDNSKENVEECVTRVVDLVNNKLNVSLDQSDIDTAHRLGKFNQSRPRNTIVKLVHRRKKSEIIRARRQLKNSKITIFDDLTKANQRKLKEAYELECVKNSFSVDGKLFVILKNNKKRRISIQTPLKEDFLLSDINFRHGSLDDY